MPDEEDGAFHIIDPREIMARQEAAVDEHRMRVEEFKRSVERFFDELTPDQMFTFHRMMLHAAHGNDAGTMHYWTGISAVYLKKIHKVCSHCGDPQHNDDEHFLAEAASANETGPAGGGPSNEELPDESLDISELDERYNIEAHEDDQFGLCVRCRTCKTVFSSTKFRISQGRACPCCEASESIGGTEA